MNGRQNQHYDKKHENNDDSELLIWCFLEAIRMRQALRARFARYPYS